LHAWRERGDVRNGGSKLSSLKLSKLILRERLDVFDRFEFIVFMDMILELRG
jgi:hypothetical protein